MVVRMMLDRLTQASTAVGPYVATDLSTAWRDLFPPELRIEARSEEREHVIRVEAPGIDPDKDVDIKIEGEVLTLTVERHEPMRDDDEEGTYCSEFSYGVLGRSITLPDGVDGDRVSATYHDAILEVRMPRVAVAHEVRRVPVSRT